MSTQHRSTARARMQKGPGRKPNTADQPLRMFRCGEVLLLYWRRGEKISGAFTILLDGEPAPKPVIGVEFKEGTAYLLAIFVKEIADLGELSVRIEAPDGELLAAAGAQKPVLLPAELVESWSLASRVRIEKALLEHSRQAFPDMSAETRRALAQSLADHRVTAVEGPGELLYVRMPWPQSGQAGLIEATFSLVSRPGEDEFSEPVKALLEGESLHFFAKSAIRHWHPDRLWELEAGKVRRVPLVIRDLKSAGNDAPLAEWLDGLAENSGAGSELLRGFAGAVALPSTARAEPPALVGRAEALVSGSVVGWAFDRRAPQKPARLTVSIDGRDAGCVEAQLPRNDLQSQGYGDCGFAWPVNDEWLGGTEHEIRFRCADTGEELATSPFRLGRGHYDGEFSLDEAGRLVGWIRERCGSPHPADLGVLVDGARCSEIEVSFEHAPTASGQDAFDTDGRMHFHAGLPDRVFDTLSHLIEVEARVDAEGAPVPIDGQLTVKASYRGHIDQQDPKRLAGWIVNSLAPKRPVRLELLVNGKPAASGIARLPKAEAGSLADNGRCGFDIPVPPQGLDCGSLTLELCLAGTDCRVLGPGVVYTPYDIALRSLTTLAEVLNNPAAWKNLAGGLTFDSDVSSWVRTQVVARLAHELRRTKRIPAQVNLSLSQITKLPSRKKPDPVVDVIVPVYMAKEAVLRCLASVLCARCETPMELIVIDDASPDPSLVAELRRLAGTGQFVLLENPVNLGFVGSVNLGMRLHPGRDVVLLNSDTAVADGWLDRLRSAAYRSNNIGTVTPFSNNATICSFPRFCESNAVPDAQSVRGLNALFAEQNAGLSVDLPTAVGFCMFIRRRVLEEVGYFDDGQWGKGYGEENDFCLRASAFGWRHVAACDVFVEHEGGVSFGDRKTEQLAGNLKKLNALYPDYAASVQRFIIQDPLAEARDRVAKALLKRHSPRYLLFVMHGLGGGAKVAADQLAAQLGREGTPVLELRSETTARWKLSSYDLPYALHYRADDFERLAEDLRQLGVWHIHFHQTLHFPRKIWDLPAILGTDYDVTAHDYLPICPRINMIDESGYYCGELQFSADNCTRCVRLNGPDAGLEAKYAEFGGNVGQWRAIYAEALRKARRVFAPSADAAQRFRSHFGLKNLKVVPHPEPRHEICPPARQEPNFKVAVIGAIGRHKGHEILLRCAQAAAKENLPLHFAILGFTADDRAYSRCDNVSISGAYRREDLPGLITASGARVALFLSPWPETYCFALTDAWRNNLFPVALDIGAVAERIRATGCGLLLPLNAEPKVINRALMDLFEQNGADWSPVVSGFELPDILGDYYGLAVASEPEIPAPRLLRPGQERLPGSVQLSELKGVA